MEMEGISGEEERKGSWGLKGNEDAKYEEGIVRAAQELSFYTITHPIVLFSPTKLERERDRERERKKDYFYIILSAILPHISVMLTIMIHWTTKFYFIVLIYNTPPLVMFLFLQLPLY